MLTKVPTWTTYPADNGSPSAFVWTGLSAWHWVLSCTARFHAISLILETALSDKAMTAIYFFPLFLLKRYERHPATCNQ